MRVRIRGRVGGQFNLHLFVFGKKHEQTLEKELLGDEVDDVGEDYHGWAGVYLSGLQHKVIFVSAEGN